MADKIANEGIADSMMNALGYTRAETADTKTETPADELLAAARMLDPGSPVHAYGRARVLGGQAEDGYHVLIAICEHHDDPDNPPDGDGAHGQCGDCVFVKLYDIDLARQVAALINARERLASWLESWDGLDIDEYGPMSDEIAHALKIARAINRSAS